MFNKLNMNTRPGHMASKPDGLVNPRKIHLSALSQSEQELLIKFNFQENTNILTGNMVINDATGWFSTFITFQF